MIVRASARFDSAAARNSGSRRSRVQAAVFLVLVVVAGLTAACTGDDSQAGRTPTRTEITSLLTRHAAALRDRDKAAFLADLTGSYRTRQAAVFANLAAVPLNAWSYAIGPSVDDQDAQRRARNERGSSAVIVRVSLRYGLTGIDARPTLHDLWWTFVRRGSSIAIAADTDLATEGGQSWRGPWDFGPVRVSSTGSALVLAHPADADLVAPLIADVNRAVPAVTAVVGTGWTRRVAVVVPGSAEERAVALGSTTSSDADVAAIATSDGQDNLSGAVLGQRVVVDPDQFRRLTSAGARLLLQHEITHVATARQTTSTTPTWLVEGFADYVGYLGNERPVRTAAAELAGLVKRDGVPTTLPDSGSFATAATSAAAYQLSWLACRRIATRHGQAALVRFYNAVGTASVPGDEAVAEAARTVLGETPAQLVARTRAYVAAQLS